MSNYEKELEAANDFLTSHLQCETLTELKEIRKLLELQLKLFALVNRENPNMRSGYYKSQIDSNNHINSSLRIHGDESLYEWLERTKKLQSD
jgi:hypothetical protein